MRQTNPHIVILIFILLTLIWGSTFPLSKISMLGFSPLLSTGLRFAGAAVLFFFFSIHQLKQIKAVDCIQALVLGSLIGLTICLQNVVLVTGDPTRVAFLSYVYVIFIPPLQLLFTHKKLHPRSIVGLIIAFGGLLVLIPPSLDGIQSGDLLIILSSVSFAVYFICIDRFERNTNVLFFNMLQCIVAAILCFGFALPFEDMYIHFDNQSALLALLYLTVVATGLGVIIHVHFQHQISPTRAAIIFILEPIFAAFITAILMGIFPTWNEILGGGIILLGVLISELRREKKTILLSEHSKSLD